MTPSREDVLAGITIARVKELAEKRENAAALAAVGVDDSTTTRACPRTFRSPRASACSSEAR